MTETAAPLNAPLNAPRRGRKSALSRGQILDAAARMLRRQGYGNTTLRKIAEVAGIQAGSIYYHFASKDEILDAVLERGVRAVYEGVRDALAALPDNVGHLQRIETAVAAHLQALLSHGDYTSASIRTYGEVPEAFQQKSQPLREAYVVLWQDLLAAAQADGAIRSDLDPHILRPLLLGSLNWTVEWYDPAQRPVADIAAQAVDMLFHGVLPKD
ncbi:MAG: TetR/AcrR family transcriptional regulator [Rhodospirillaceae bacterium]|jgi:AcrR family transcriptional regulator|nr:TetR/AcrR family transcriptional regulator [Rhodospirillaceae bacterium]MBT4687511.1 TetR/AcrR family transcriptional regulator [Rhodospirillaceae bacterium]MBT5080213.1 TetR/AcrR family transcriptional regulator [Rhodospirillaceae bacterium]MBT5527088.1 TetR/AcrR family transcriptional regulator [Rhodospirillaceae bacterium]MBT5881984.1 TetR/AcrR family transcriptional regulator [Rhodospirillaceae bacterium]